MTRKAEVRGSHLPAARASGKQGVVDGLLSCAQIPNPQKMGDNKCMLFSATRFVVMQQ